MKRILTVCSVIFILCALLATSQAQAAPAAPDAECTSTDTGNWSTMTWTGCTPGTSDDVVINTSVIVNASVEVKSIRITDTGTLSFGGNHTLTINGGNFTNNGTFTSNSTGTVAFTGLSHTIGGSEVTIFNNLTIDGPDGDTATVIYIGDATYPSIEPKIDGTLSMDRNANGSTETANPITWVQTLSLPGNGSSNVFVQLTDSSTPEPPNEPPVKLNGVEVIDDSDDTSTLNNVTVRMTLRRINTNSSVLNEYDLCNGVSTQHALRCYEITTNNGDPSTSPAYLYFYLPSSEANGFTCEHITNGLAPFRLVDTTWTILTNGTCEGDDEDLVYDINGKTAGFSHFILGGEGVTSVELVDLSARPASIPTAAPILLGAAAFLTGGILAFRKLRRR